MKLFRGKSLLFSLLLILVFQPLVFGKKTPTLLGAWQSRGPAGTVDLVFQSNNRLIFDGEPANYTLAPGVIKVQDGHYVVDYPYFFSGENLVISFPEGYQMVFSRVDGNRAPISKPGAGRHTGTIPGQVDSAELAGQIAGVWWGYSGSTERKIGLCPNGHYMDYSESSYGGSSYDAYGNQTMAWGSAGQAGGSGQWSIQGDYQQGIIQVSYNNGGQATIQYRQSGESGCLFFNGNKLCRTSADCN